MSTTDEDLLTIYLLGLGSGITTALSQMGAPDEHAYEQGCAFASLVENDPLAREEIINNVRLSLAGEHPKGTTMSRITVTAPEADDE